MASPECATARAQCAADCQVQFPGGRVPEHGTSPSFGAGRGESGCALPPRGAKRPAAKFLRREVMNRCGKTFVLSLGTESGRFVLLLGNALPSSCFH